MEENNYTLEQMRADYQQLKERLENQEIINDRLMRETMSGKVRSMRGTVGWSIGCAVFVFLMAPLIFHYNPVVNASWAFTIATMLMMAFCIFLDWKFNHKVQGTDLSNCDMLTFSKHVREMKENYSGWIKWAFVIIVLWAGWLIAEVLFNVEEKKLAIPMVVGLLFGLIVGGIIGYSMDRKIIRTCSEIINQIES